MKNIAVAFKPEHMAQQDHEHGTMQLTIQQIQSLTHQLQDWDSTID